MALRTGVSGVLSVSDYTVCSDEELIDLSRAGDNDALDFLIGRYVGLVRQKAFRFFLVGADKEDLIQEGLIGLFKATRDYDVAHGVPFKSFADTCIMRQIATAIKAATRLKHGPLNNSISLSQPLFENDEAAALMDVICRDTLPNPEEIVINKERYHVVSERIEKILSRFEKQVLGYYLQGKSYHDIALKLDKPQKAVDNALQRVKRKLTGIAEERTK